MTETSPTPPGRPAPGRDLVRLANGPLPCATVQGWCPPWCSPCSPSWWWPPPWSSSSCSRRAVRSPPSLTAALPAQAQAYRLQGALLDQETGVRGFGITGQPSFLQPYTAGVATCADAAARLRALIGHDQLLAADLGHIQQGGADGQSRSYAMLLIAPQPRAAERAGHRAAGPEQAVLRSASRRCSPPGRTPPGGGHGPQQQPDGKHPHDHYPTCRHPGRVFLLASAVPALTLRNAVVRAAGPAGAPRVMWCAATSAATSRRPAPRTCEPWRPMSRPCGASWPGRWPARAPPRRRRPGRPRTSMPRRPTCCAPMPSLSSSPMWPPHDLQERLRKVASFRQPSAGEALRRPA